MTVVVALNRFRFVSRSLASYRYNKRIARIIRSIIYRILSKTIVSISITWSSNQTQTWILLSIMLKRNLWETVVRASEKSHWERIIGVKLVPSYLIFGAIDNFFISLPLNIDRYKDALSEILSYWPILTGCLVIGSSCLINEFHWVIQKMISLNIERIHEWLLKILIRFDFSSIQWDSKLQLNHRYFFN